MIKTGRLDICRYLSLPKWLVYLGLIIPLRLLWYYKIAIQVFEIPRFGEGMSSGWDESNYSDEAIEYTPMGGFDIRGAARIFAKMMRESLQPLIIHLPHVSVEFEPGCTAKEIIDGYHYAMASRRVGRRHSNANTRSEMTDSP